jgi:chromosomal replication initiator protein
LCRVEQPDRDTREQIVVRKAGLLALRLVPESARLLAASSCTSVRELEGLLHTLRNLHRIPDQPVPPGLVRQVVAEIERDCVRVVRLPDIERVICETFGVSVEDLRSERRTRTVAEPRMLAMYLARRHTRAAYAEIGAYFGGRNHATVMSAEKRMQQAVADNARVQVAISQWGVADLVQALEQRLLAG